MKIIGHRGAKGLAPENTLAAIEKALEHHVDGVEVDVRITRDHVAVLLHDSDARDAAGDKLQVNKHSYDELKSHKPDMPTLAEAIALIDRRVPIIIEVKPNEATAPVIKVVHEFLDKGWRAADLQFISFDFRLLKELHEEFPEHLIIVDEMWSGVRAMSRARRLDTKHISLYTPFIWSGFIRAVTARGYQLYSFPLNDAKKAKRWTQGGFYCAITDYPDLFDQ